MSGRCKSHCDGSNRALKGIAARRVYRTPEERERERERERKEEKEGVT